MDELEMSRGITSPQGYEEVVKLYNLCFDANSLCDRISYICSVKFNMIDFGNWFHHNIAHAFTGDNFADGIEAYGELRSDLFYRSELPRHNEDYASIVDAMRAFVLKVTEIEKQCVKALHVCADNGDEGFEDFLRELNVSNISPMLKQAMVFYNATREYQLSNDIHKWNKDFYAWIIPYFLEDDEDDDN